MRMFRWLSVIAVMGLALGVDARQASAAVLTFNYNIEFSGATAPEGPAPWLTAVFTDSGDPDNTVVQLTLSTAGLSDGAGGEFVTKWYFNLNPAYNPSSLVITPVNTSAVGSTTIQRSLDGLSADGSGYYDWGFDFPTSGNRFTEDETVTFNLSRNDGGVLTVADFNFTATKATGSNGLFLSAAHVQGIDPGNKKSGWIAPTTSTSTGGTNGSAGSTSGQTPVPEPASLLMLGSGLVLAARRLRRRQGRKG